ncbi:MAG: M20 family metallo-hydrolase [Spirochaetes bacterium]|nr:M20 family metallo-hydrolase [Spirochaetota bacterium]
MKELFYYIESLENTVIELQKGLTKIPAINPENGGDGEYNKYLYLKKYLKRCNFDKIEDILVPDERVTSKIRPSIIATLNGKDSSKTLWIITHLDVVPPGEIKLWKTDPFEAIVKNGKIYGRGTEDNQQSLISSLIAAIALIEKKITPFYTVKLLFVADEEVGSQYGIDWILENTSCFSKQDLILTPDGGHPEGKTIEIAEKSILWISFKIIGKQSHGSRPDLGINAARACSYLCVRMEKIKDIFNALDPMYDLPYSTFEPTKRTNSITNMNTIPGEETIGFDCRILPQYNLNEVKDEMKKIVKSVEKDFEVKIEIEVLQDIQAPNPTPANSIIVGMLQGSIKKILNIHAKPIGIGGGTVAAYLRMKGYNAALWSTVDNTMHSPNEYSIIKSTINDAKVFADLMVGLEG